MSSYIKTSTIIKNTTIHLIRSIPIVFLLGHIALVSKSVYFALVILITISLFLFKKKLFILIFLLILDLIFISYSESYFQFKKNSVKELRFLNHTFFSLESSLRNYIKSDIKVDEKLFNSEIRNNSFMIKMDYQPVTFFNHKEKKFRTLFEIGEIYPIHFSNNTLIGYFEDTKYLISYNIIENKLNWMKKLDGYPHHWGQVHDEKIYVLEKKFKKQPNNYTDLFSEYDYGKCDSEISILDYLTVLDYKTGDYISKIDVFQSIFNSFPTILSENFLKEPAPPVLKGAPIQDYAFDCNDTLHLNDIRVFKDEIHSFFYNASPGDLLISGAAHHFFVIDHKTHFVKWFSGVLTNGHVHSPRITPTGTLLYFNNSACERSENNEIKCFSQLVNFNPENNNITKFNFDKKYITGSRGVLDIINKNELIVQFSDTGTIVRVYCEDSVANLSSCKVSDLLSNENMKKERIYDFTLIDE